MPEKFASLKLHIHEEYKDSFWLELTLGGDGEPTRSRCIGDVLNRREADARRSAAAASLIFAGYAVTG